MSWRTQNILSLLLVAAVLLLNCLPDYSQGRRPTYGARGDLEANFALQPVREERDAARLR
jgi:hypothetical protein